MWTSERRILRRMKELGGLKPAPQSTDRAMAAARAALGRELRNQQADKTRRLIMRFAMPAAIAAALLIALVVLWPSTSQVANAAEMLKAAAASSRDYNGWIHASFDFIPEVFNREGITVKASSMHFHPARKIIVKDISLQATRTIDWRDLAANVEKTYDSAANTITIADIPPDPGNSGSLTENILKMLRTEKKATAWQIGQTLFGMPTLDGVNALVENGWCGVTAAREDENDRYTLTFLKERLEDPAEAAKASLVVLVDHKTGLIRKWLATFPEGKIALTFTYDEPAFRDITDMNIPADVKIDRPVGGGHTTSADASAILDRLDKLAGSDRQLGPYTAVITRTYDVGKGHSPDRGMQIFARTGASQFYGFYRNLHQAPFLKDIPGWPVPDLAAAIVAAGDTLPDIVVTSDGTAAWMGRVDRYSKVSWMPIKPEDLATPEWMGFDLTVEIWSGRHHIDFKHGTRIKIDIQALTAPDRPGQVGVQVDESGTVMRSMGHDRMQMIWWTDPSRDDVPTIKVKRFYDSQGNVSYEDVTTYTEYDRFPNGLWYPTAWQTVSNEYKNGQPKVISTCDCRLQFVPGMTLDATWFSKPQDHFRPASDKRSAASQPIVPAESAAGE